MSDDVRNYSADDASETSNTVVLTLRIPETTSDEVSAICKASGLKQSDVLRLALKRGLPVVNSQLNPEGEP